MESIRSVPRAGLNLVITPGYGLAIAKFLKERFNMPYISPRHMPIGFDATASLLSEVLDFFGLPAPSELTAEENRCRREALLALSHSSRSEMIRGLPVAVFGERGFTVGLTDFLKSYLGCCPVLAAVQGADDGDAQTIARAAGPDARILFNPDPGLAMEAVGQAKPAILFGSSFERYIMDQMSYHPRFFVETGLPRFNRANLVFRPHIGFAGALTFIEAVLNCPLTPAYPYTAGGNASRFQGPMLSTD